jgi:acetaldehyde dehydrogenase (acetylating)
VRRDAGFIATGAGIDVPAGSRVLVNTCSALGAVGVTTRLEPSLTLGPGAWGGSATGDNVSARHLTNRKRLAWDRDALPKVEEPRADEISDERLRQVVRKVLDELDA